MSAPLIDRFYFGVDTRQAGHYWWLPGARENQLRCGFDYPPPWGATVDGRLQPHGRLENEQGPCALHHKDGWTAIAWWDRSGPDKRPGCCSVYAQRGEHDFDAMVAAFRASFPWAAQRMGFDLTRIEGFPEAFGELLQRHVGHRLGAGLVSAVTGGVMALLGRFGAHRKRGTYCVSSLAAIGWPGDLPESEHARLVVEPDPHEPTRLLVAFVPVEGGESW